MATNPGPVDAPAYVRLRDLLRQEIRSGRLHGGEQLPTEFELMGLHDLSRHTVRMALDLLRDEGLVRRQPGRGTFVTPGASEHRDPTLVTADEAIWGLALETPMKVLEPFRRVDDPEPARRLGVEPGDAAGITFMRAREGSPVGVWSVWIPGALFDEIADIASDLDGSSDSVIQLVERATGRFALSAEQLLTAENATAAQARILAVPRGAALLRSERTYADHEGRPLEYLVARYVPAEYTYRVQLLRKISPREGAAARRAGEPSH
jgi:GntR family transcriptional regulator